MRQPTERAGRESSTLDDGSTRSKRRLRGLLAAALVCLVIGAVGVAPPVDASNDRGTTDLVVEETTVGADDRAAVALRLAEAPDGLAGFEVTLELDGDGVASIQGATYADDFGMTTAPIVDSDGRTVTVEAVDLDDEITAGERDVTLATVDVSGLESGETTLRVTDAQLDADGGDAIEATHGSGTITVGSATGTESADESNPGDALPGFGAFAALVAVGYVGCRRCVQNW